jgi:DnaJ-class molecular chaperone
MKRICDRCHGNGYVTVAFEEYADCPTCFSQGEYEDELVEEALGAAGAERELGE